MASVLGTSASVRADRWFYVRLAAAFVATAFLGFAPTYWAPLAAGHYAKNPITHIHGMLFFGWTLTYLVQTILVASGRTLAHRSFGMFGIALFSAMCASVLLALLNEVRVYDALGVGDAVRRFVSVPMIGLVALIFTFTLAISQTRQPDIHKRLMVLTIAMMAQPALARWFQFFLAPPGAIGPPPVPFALMPGLLALGFIVAGAVHDKRMLGHVHRVYRIGGPLVALEILSPVLVSQTAAWMGFIHWFERLAP